MSKIMELADAYARETYPALITEARAALVAEVEKLEAENERLKSSIESYITLANTAYEITEQRTAELEAARKDAARYRWLRQWTVTWSDKPQGEFNSQCLDAAIDAAMGATK